MEIVAIAGASGDPDERAAALATATGMPVYQARRHVAGGGPRVVATYGVRQAALDAADALRRAGFETVVIGAAALARMRLDVRAFEFEEQAILASDREGARLRVPYADVAVLVRGVRAGDGPDEREPFVAVHGGSGALLVFREAHLQYDGLHLERQPTAAANFVRLASRLRGRAIHAAYDERLNTRAGQLAVLGDVLTPEAHLDVAIELVARTLRRLRSAA